VRSARAPRGKQPIHPPRSEEPGCVLCGCSKAHRRQQSGPFRGCWIGSRPRPSCHEARAQIARTIKELRRAEGGELHNISSFTGGLVAQEALKVITRQPSSTFITNRIPHSEPVHLTLAPGPIKDASIIQRTVLPSNYLQRLLQDSRYSNSWKLIFFFREFED
jgi:hypothetical protein